MKVRCPVFGTDLNSDSRLIAYAPVLLEQRAKQLRKGSDVEKNVEIRTIYEEKIDRKYERSRSFINPKSC